ncbi:Mitochondrial inner membrane protease atp23 [Kappamyces sp. JEL0680]|nr:Mitochondrial inner membrane protease atp23 [Kappamyces sp. JEL0680]
MESEPLKQHAKCVKWTEKMISSSPILTFLLKEISVFQPAEHVTAQIHCRPCGDGGFSPHNGIVLCENQLESKSHLEDTLAHELVHAFDQASVKNMDWTSLKVQACTEIRAVNLSGECRFTRELRRGHFGVAKHHQECVKRRAVLGVMQSANLKDENGRKDAERAVLNVWNDCFPDTAPFDEIF